MTNREFTVTPVLIDCITLSRLLTNCYLVTIHSHSWMSNKYDLPNSNNIIGVIFTQCLPIIQMVLPTHRQISHPLHSCLGRLVNKPSLVLRGCWDSTEIISVILYGHPHYVAFYRDPTEKRERVYNSPLKPSSKNVTHFHLRDHVIFTATMMEELISVLNCGQGNLVLHSRICFSGW